MSVAISGLDDKRRRMSNESALIAANDLYETPLRHGTSEDLTSELLFYLAFCMTDSVTVSGRYKVPLHSRVVPILFVSNFILFRLPNRRIVLSSVSSHQHKTN